MWTDAETYKSLSDSVSFYLSIRLELKRLKVTVHVPHLYQQALVPH
jgi:hypothetical protein